MPSRPTPTALTRIAVAATAGVVVALTALVAPGPAAASAGSAAATAASVPADARLAAGWLAGERDGDGGVPGPFAGTDWGLTVDTLWAMKAAGASTVDLQRTWGAIEANATELAGPPSWSTDTTLRYGGGTAKVLVAAQSVGADPRAVRAGGTSHDLVAATLARIATTGPQVGRLEDSASAGFDSTNVFSQAIAVIGLSDARLTRAADTTTLASAVTFLGTQQCAPGWFRVFYDDDLTCDAALAKGDAAGDVDGTAIAVQAMVAARDRGISVDLAALGAAAGYLVSAQHSDGSFGGGAGASGANANSTGLAAAALQLTGRTTQAARARSWVAGLQLVATTGALASERGAIAYDAAALADARTHGISAAGRDQWRRATAQAVFALNPVGLAQLAGLPSGTGLPTPPTTTPTTPATPETRPTTRPATTPRATSAPASTQPPQPAGARTGPVSTTRSDGAAGPGPLGGGSGSLSSASVPLVPSARPVLPSAAATGVDLPAVSDPPAQTPTPTPAPDDAAALASARTDTETPAGGFWRSPLVLAVGIGVLMGALVVLRPWRLLGGRAR
ncbi:hypothetical protein V3N99_02720 [Dermatophilaceae bacterium Soc4.6]